jgi:hypothetical protein
MQLAADQERYMAKWKAERKEGDDDEGDEAELSDNEDTGVQEEDDEEGMETGEAWWRGRHHLGGGWME